MKRKSKEYQPFILGICFCFGIFMMILPLVLFRSSIRSGKNVFTVRFVDISGISEGAAVYFAGKPVGKVSEIKNVIDQGEKNLSGYLYTYELVLKIDPEAVILPEDEITLTFPRLIGEKVVNICPKDSGERKLLACRQFYGKNPDVFKKGEELMEVLESLSQSLSENMAQMTLSCSSFVNYVQDHSLLRDLSEVLERVKGSSEFLSKDTAANFMESIENVHEITKDIRDYGILYQYNKNWKKKKIRPFLKSN